MNELESKISSMIESLDELTKVLNKSKSSGEDMSITILYKKIEDGILEKIHDANEHQLNMMINSYKFRFYTEFNDKELLRSEIQKRLRNNKLEKLLK